MKFSRKVCIKQISGAAINRRAAFQTEMAVGLAIYAEFGKAGKSARAALYQIYDAAGYSCKDASGEDYRTVHRRVTAAAKLFGHMGLEKLTEMVGDLTDLKAIQAILEGVTKLDVTTINGMLALDKPAVETKPKKPPTGFKIDLPTIHFVVPQKATVEDLLALAERLIKLAGERKTAPTKRAPRVVTAEERKGLH